MTGDLLDPALAFNIRLMKDEARRFWQILPTPDGKRWEHRRGTHRSVTIGLLHTRAEVVAMRDTFMTEVNEARKAGWRLSDDIL